MPLWPPVRRAPSWQRAEGGAELVISGVPGKLPLKTIKRELVGSGGRHLPILLLDSVVMATPSQMENQRLRAIGQM